MFGLRFGKRSRIDCVSTRLDAGKCEECNERFKDSYFLQLLGEYNSLGSSDRSRSPEADEEIRIILKEVDGNKHCRCDQLFRLERALIKLQPIERVKLKVHLLREKYASLYPQYAKHSDGKSRSGLGGIFDDWNKEKTDEKEIRAEAEYLVGEINVINSLIPARETKRIDLSFFVLRALITILSLLGLLVYGLKQLASIDIMLTYYAGSFGALGAFISMCIRLQDPAPNFSPVSDFLQMKYGQSSLYMAPLIGAIFGILLLPLLSGDMISGAFFPKLKFEAPSSNDSSTTLFFSNIRPDKNGVDTGKLII